MGHVLARPIITRIRPCKPPADQLRWTSNDDNIFELTEADKPQMWGFVSATTVDERPHASERLSSSHSPLHVWVRK
jgi:hypothetical protein